MTRTIAAMLIVLGALLAGCSHHQDHHTGGEEHWHHAASSQHAHDSDTAHRLDSHQDDFHID